MFPAMARIWDRECLRGLLGFGFIESGETYWSTRRCKSVIENHPRWGADHSQSEVSAALWLHRMLLVLWFFGSLVLWFFGSLVLWFFGSLVLWFFGSLVLWFFGSLVLVSSFVASLVC
jgi:hypothetical protein